MKPHPAADLFPMLDEDATWSLVNDIKLHGLLHPIITWNGQIVDGRNRDKACDLAGIKPRYKEMTFGSERDAIAYIISTNIHRRHLTTSQRAMIAAELANLMPGSNQYVHKLKDGSEVRADSGEPLQKCRPSETAGMMQVAERTVYQAKKVIDDAPDLAAKVKSGELKVSKAASMARERTKPQTDPDAADDRVVDAETETAAQGYTKRMYQKHAAIIAMDATEITAHIELLRRDGYIK